MSRLRQYSGGSRDRARTFCSRIHAQSASAIGAAVFGLRISALQRDRFAWRYTAKKLLTGTVHLRRVLHRHGFLGISQHAFLPLRFLKATEYANTICLSFIAFNPRPNWSHATRLS